jgi:hypothetical protein
MMTHALGIMEISFLDGAHGKKGAPQGAERLGVGQD